MNVFKWESTMNISFKSKLGEDVARRAYQFYEFTKPQPESNNQENRQTKDLSVLEEYKPFQPVIELWKNQFKPTKSNEELEKEADIFIKNNSNHFITNKKEDQMPTIDPETEEALTVDNFVYSIIYNRNTLLGALTNFNIVKERRENAIEKNKTRPPEKQVMVPVLPDLEDYNWIKFAEHFMKCGIENITKYGEPKPAKNNEAVDNK